MGRSRQYAKRRVDTWFDKDFRALTLEQQGLYDALCASPDLSRCGVIPWIPSRLAQCSDGLTVKKLTRLVENLTDTDHLRVDYEIAELLVRSHIRHDEGLRTPNIARSIARAFDSIMSPFIRQSVVTELARLLLRFPDLPGWPHFAEENPDLYDELLSQSLPDGSW